MQGLWDYIRVGLVLSEGEKSVFLTVNTPQSK